VPGTLLKDTKARGAGIALSWRMKYNQMGNAIVSKTSGGVMSKMVLDAETQERLKELKTPVELCDAAGETFGHFLPQKVYQEIIGTWASAQFTEEQVHAALQQTGGRPLADIWKDLGRS
jgi:hypothetical protein